MTPAVMGLWFLALAVVAARRPGWLVPAAVLCAPFEGAAVMAGGFGVSPYFFALVLIAGRCVLVRTDRPHLLGRTPGQRRAMAWMAAFTALAVGGAAVLPRAFAGTLVLSPRIDAEVASRLSFTASNLAQAVYLLLNVGLLWYAAQTGGTAAGVGRVVAATRAAGAVVVALAAYQFAAAVAGLPYPDDVLYSNTAYVMQHGTAVLDLPRLCSTFTEPTAMAVYLVGFLAFLMAEPPSASRLAAGVRVGGVVATAAALALSTSSTAYLGLAAAAGWAVVRFVAWPLVTGRRPGRAAAVVVTVVAAGAVAFAASGTLRDVVQRSVFEKNDSSSYAERSAADAFSTRLIGTTWGLGVGLGSNRASGFGPSLLSTVGVYGAGALAGAMSQLLRPPAAPAGPARRWHPPLAAGLVGVVATKMVSSPDLVTPTMWALMAALVCVRGAAEASPDEAPAAGAAWPAAPFAGVGP